MKLKISELHKITNMIFEHLENSGHEELEIEYDYYWLIAENECYDMTKEPKVESVGQLTEDLDILKKIASSDSAVTYDLVPLSHILRVVGETAGD